MTVSLSEILSASLEEAFGDPVFVFRKMLRLKTGEVAQGWSKLNNEELQDLYSLLSSTGVEKTGSLRSLGLMARMREQKYIYCLTVRKRMK
jgi:hypothetical protein